MLQTSSAAAVGAVYLFASPATAQTTPSIVVPDSPCNECRISLAWVATLGADADPLSPSAFQVGVTQDSRGLYYLAPTADLAVMAVYDQNGSFLKALGRAGEGPEEYGFIMRTEVMPGDSLLVLDVGNYRLTVLSPLHAPVRSMRMNGRFTSAAVLPDGRLLVHGRVRSPERAGFPLHILAPDGRITDSFGSVVPESRRDRPQADLRQLSAVRDGKVWTAHLDRYEMELWSLEGELLRSVTRRTEWFQPWDYIDGQELDVSLQPMTVAVWQDRQERLWTMVRVPAPDARPPTRARAEREQPMPPFDVVDAGHDSIIEVIDPLTGRLLASQRFPQYLMGAIGEDIVYSMRATPEGDLRIDIWRVELET